MRYLVLLMGPGELPAWGELSAAEQDRYLADTAVVAEKLGAVDVPRSRAAVADYYARILPELRADHRTREVAAALLAPGDDPAAAAALAVASAAAVDSTFSTTCPAAPICAGRRRRART